MGHVRLHGHAKYVLEVCRCKVCTDAALAYERNRRRQIAYGRWQPFVPAEPVREHVRHLQAAGLGHRRIAQIAGISTGTMSRLMYGDYVRTLAASRRVRSKTATKILGVQPKLEYLGDTVSVDPTGTRRRLQALVAIGWSQTKLATRLDMEPASFTRTLRLYPYVTAKTARAVRELYEELWATPPTANTHRDRIAKSRSQRRARELGWAPPLAWDDDAIDDPDATPEGVGGDRRHGNQKLPPVDDLRFLISCGESVAAIAARFHVREDAVEQAFVRAEREAS